MTSKIRLGDLLVRAGVLDQNKLQTALAEQQKWGGRLGKVLVDMNFLSEDLLVKALSKQLQIPRASFQDMNVPAQIIEQITAAFAERHGICPEHYDPSRRLLVVAMTDPGNLDAIDEVRFKTGLRVETTIAGETQLAQALETYLGVTKGPEGIDLGIGSSRGPTRTQPNSVFDAAMAASGTSLSLEPVEPPMPAATPPPAAHVRAPAPQYAAAPAVAAATGFHPAAPHPAMPPQPTIPPQRAAPAGAMPPQPTMPPQPVPAAAMPPQPAGGVSSAHSGSARVEHSAVEPALAVSPLSGGAAPEWAHRLQSAQKRQLKAIRAMAELLIEKGVITRQEFEESMKK